MDWDYMTLEELVPPPPFSIWITVLPSTTFSFMVDFFTASIRSRDVATPVIAERVDPPICDLVSLLPFAIMIKNLPVILDWFFRFTY